MDRGAFGLDYVELYIKKGNTTVKLSLRESAGDEEKLISSESFPHLPARTLKQRGP